MQSTFIKRSLRPQRLRRVSEVISLSGLTPYAQAHALQLRCVDERIAGEREDTLIFAEHPAVVTRGRGLQLSRNPQAKERARHAPLLGPLPEGVTLVDIERGGDLTYHGPGQLVIYPILYLAERDIHAYLRRLESTVATELDSWGVPTHSDEDATGVWVSARGVRKKVASIGIAVRKWVTYHGMGLNLRTDLGHFRWITPCGFDPEVMTSLEELAREYPRIPDEALGREFWEKVFARAFLFAR